MDSPRTVGKDSRAPLSRLAGRRVHFIGIGGCGMAGLALMLLDGGALVSGSEPKPNAQTFELTRRGVPVSRTQLGELLNRQTDLVVRSAAVSDTNPEMSAARALGIPTVKYAQMLGRVMEERFGVAVAGTHGKSTTTAMIAYALMKTGADPSFVVGGTSSQLGGSSRSGQGGAFVVEACEYDRSFHNLHPRVALITNIEEDHLDCYKDIDDIVASFAVFAGRVPADGLIIANGRDARVSAALAGASARRQTVGLGEGMDWSTRVIGTDNGCWHGEVSRDGRAVAELRMSVAGEHNLFDASMALAACAACGADLRRSAEALSAFRGVDRRMTEMGRYHGAVLVDDYAHHPTEIRATLAAIRAKYTPLRLVCVFQPHQHSRTRFLMEDFASCFAQADQTIVPDIYFVRDSEAEKTRVCSEDLVRRIQRNGQEARHVPQLPAITDYLRGQARDGDVIVTMGAGNVWEICRDLAST